MNEDDSIKYLDNSEILTMELNHEKAKISKLEIEKIELRKELIQKEKKLLELTFKLHDSRLQDYSRLQLDLKNQEKARKKVHADWIDWIKMKYELDDFKGFDPDSGEIKTD